MQIVDRGDVYTISAWRQMEAQSLKLQTQGAKLSFRDLHIIPYENFFLPTLKVRLDAAQRKSIVANARELLSSFYVHEPFKREQRLLDNLPFDPFGDLDKVDQLPADVPDDTFHFGLREVFVQHIDAHTKYKLPAPYANSVAFLPCQIKHYYDDSDSIRFTVSQLMEGFTDAAGTGHAFFQTGVEVVGYDGQPIMDAIKEIGRHDFGGNPSAFLLFSISRLYLRTLAYALRPDVGTAAIDYVPLDGGPQRQIILPWGVGSAALNSAVVFQNHRSSVSEEHVATAYAGTLLYSTSKCLNESLAPVVDDFDPVNMAFKDLFEFQTADGSIRDGFLEPDALSGGPGGQRFGYLRIKSFGHSVAPDELTNEGEIAAEFARLLGILMDRAPDGLVLDIRGNGGGNIKAAEMMLQMLTPRDIQPANFHWPNNQPTVKILQTGNRLKAGFGSLSYADQAVSDGLVEYADWFDDLHLPPSDLPPHLFTGKTLTSLEDANDTGQIYQSPVALLIDGFTYSAADIFAAGFKDNKVGPIIGVSDTTGGGGATVWKYDVLNPIISTVAGVPLTPLPQGVEMTVAVQRATRVRDSLGVAIEGVGVQADLVFNPTRNDVLKRGEDLMKRVCRLMSLMPAYRLKVIKATLTNKSVLLNVAQSTNIVKLEARIAGQPLPLVDLGNGDFSLAIADTPDILELRGFNDQGDLVVATRSPIEVPTAS